jgi:Na+-transporting NADH:ubiquinone oxidoreductase subunit C
MNKQSLVYTVIFTFVVSFVFVLLLAFANEGTRALVLTNQRVARQRAVLNAMDIPYEDTNESIQNAYQAVEEIERDGETLFRAEVDGRTVWAKEFTGNGLWGRIEGVLAVNDGFDRTVGIEIISHNETPGLGGRIDEPWFKLQLAGERIVDGKITVGAAGGGDTDSDNGKIDAVTGASRTSDAMQSILDSELSRLATILEARS